MDIKEAELQHRTAFDLSKLQTSGEFWRIQNELSSVIKVREITWPMTVSVFVKDCWVKTVWALYICAVMMWALHVCAVIVSIICFRWQWTFSQLFCWTFKFSGMLWSAIVYYRSQCLKDCSAFKPLELHTMTQHNISKDFSSSM
jgi:hypothetical protein